MNPSINRLALPLGLTFGLGYAFVPLGCGGVTIAGEVPESVARPLRACVVEHRNHVGTARNSVDFEVKLKSDGQVDKVAILYSTLGDQELEKCMAIAIKQLSEDNLPLRRSENRDRDRVAPESRSLLGQAQALPACLATAPCLLTLTVLVGAAYIYVTLYVYGTNTHRPPLAEPHVEESQKKDPKPAGDPKTTGTTTPILPPPDCPRNESFAPERTDNAMGCIAKNGHLRCYAGKHRPCAGVHTHGKLSYQEIRNGVCKSIKKDAVRCEGPFIISGPCGSVPTVQCKTGGPEISGIHEER